MSVSKLVCEAGGMRTTIGSESHTANASSLVLLFCGRLVKIPSVAACTISSRTLYNPSKSRALEATTAILVGLVVESLPKCDPS